MPKYTYETERWHGMSGSITSCPEDMHTKEQNILLGGYSCQMCQYFVSHDNETRTVECKGNPYSIEKLRDKWSQK